MLVSQIMTPDPVSLAPETSLKKAARLLSEHAVSGAPVVVGGRVVGVLSAGDLPVSERPPLVAWLSPRAQTRLAARAVRDVMTVPAWTVAATDPVAAAAQTMLDRNVHRVPVVEAGGALVGIVTRGDLLRAFSRPDREIAAEVEGLVVLACGGGSRPETLEVRVVDGDVTLACRVPTRRIARLLPEHVARVPGVVSIDARLRSARESAPHLEGRLSRPGPEGVITR